MNASNISYAKQLSDLHEASHQTSHIAGWLIYVFSMLAFAIGIGLVGGIWQSVTGSMRSESFKNYCYAVWSVLSVGLLLATAFIIYFHYNMNDLRQKGLDNIERVFGTGSIEAGKRNQRMMRDQRTMGDQRMMRNPGMMR